MGIVPDLNKQMQHDIISGVFKDVMPPIRQLALHYKVGVSTMKLALKQLKNDGFLIGHQGKCIRINPLALNNKFYRKDIVFFVSLARLELRLYAKIIETLRMTFETYGAYIHIVSSIRQLQLCRFNIDILIAAEPKKEDLQYLTENFSADKVILLNSSSDIFDNVGTDNFIAGYEAAKYLHNSKKHTNIGILSRYLDYKISHNKSRCDGAKKYFNQHPEIKLYEADTENFTDEHAAIDALFAQNPDISAVFATMDTLAFHIYTYAAEKNIKIPSELAVIGFDNSYFCEFTNPPLSTFAENTEGISQKLMEIAAAKLTGKNTEKQTLCKPIFIPRQSV